MMKKFILAILILIKLSGYSQPITYSKLYNPYNKNTNSLGIGIQKKGNGYITVAVGGDTINIYKNNVIFNEIDSIGNLLKTTTFASDIADFWAGGIGSLIKTSDGGYFIPCSINYNESNGDHYLVRFNSNMDTLWTKTIDHDSVWEIYYQSCETYDKGFAMVGLRVISPSLYDVLLVKTDSLGNKLWEKTISMGNYNGGDQIKETPDKGLLLCGYRSSNVDGSGDPFIIKTDSMGNILWHRILGSPAHKDGGASFAITPQGDYLVAYGYSTYTYPMNEAWLARLNVIKYSPDGNQIWNKMYDTIRVVYSINKIQLLSNNDFIIMGAYGKRNIVDNFYHYESFLFKFNSIGDSLWCKAYFYSDKLVDENILRDFLINADGGITAIGHVNFDTMYPRQKIWIVKTDSNGYAPGPQNYVGIIDLPYLQIGYGGMKVYPNPATTQTTISYPSTEKGIILQLYNMLGQLIYEEKLSKGSSQTCIDTRAYKKGLYKVVVGESSASLMINN